MTISINSLIIGIIGKSSRTAPTFSNYFIVTFRLYNHVPAVLFSSPLRKGEVSFEENKIGRKWSGEEGAKANILPVCPYEEAAALGFEHVLPPCARIALCLVRIEGPGQIEGPVVGL